MEAALAVVAVGGVAAGFSPSGLVLYLQLLDHVRHRRTGCRNVMPVFRHEILIKRPVDAVFAAVADVHSHPQWQAGLLETHAPGGALGLGEKGVEVRRLFGRVARFPYEITHFDPPHTRGFRTLDGPIRPSARLGFKSGQTGTTITSELTVPGLAGWLLGPLMLRQQRRNYQRLKTLLEAGKL